MSAWCGQRWSLIKVLFSDAKRGTLDLWGKGRILGGGQGQLQGRTQGRRGTLDLILGRGQGQFFNPFPIPGAFVCLGCGKTFCMYVHKMLHFHCKNYNDEKGTIWIDICIVKNSWSIHRKVYIIPEQNNRFFLRLRWTAHLINHTLLPSWSGTSTDNW